METATSALIYIMKNGQRSKSRANAIDELKKTLRSKHQILTKVNTKYEKIQKEEKELKQSLEKVCILKKILGSSHLIFMEGLRLGLNWNTQCLLARITDS